MKTLWEWIKRGYLRVIEPFADYFVRKRVNPNTITTIGTLCSIAAGVIYATGHIMTAGWVLGLTALFDVLDGTVARRTGRSTVFGAFYDSTLDRIADGAVLGGLAIFFARNDVHQLIPGFAGTPMVGVTLLGIIGTYLTSYTRARAESLGIDAKVGIMQRPERVTLLSAPQAFFGLVFDGWVLIAIVLLLSVTAWITAIQRIVYVYHATKGLPPEQLESMRQVPRFTPDQSQLPIPGDQNRAHSTIGEAARR
ncbi:MAG: CDP-alcohol phosphatidyltransferase [Geminicoccaceae bacterium]|jgi:CDP-diacylglycerol--glycerol-3-phosphate 3-phosphatidyltransferase|nr:CDP-alcohol phosphatidyltransferase [Geminicoccaceae bacterium]